MTIISKDALTRERLANCQLCVSDQLVRDAFARRTLSLDGLHAVSQCLECRLRFLSPRPSAEQYRSFYNGQGDVAANYPFPAGYYQDQARQRTDEYLRKIRLLQTRAGRGCSRSAPARAYS